MLKAIIQQLVERQSLSQQQATEVFTVIMRGEATPPQIAALITALRMKGETVAEITGAAAALRACAQPIQVERRPLLDTCGTGGDGKQTFNISTVAAIVAAGAGIAVAKHGNRSVTSRCGSADLLETLGVSLTAEAAVVAHCIQAVGIGFLFAPSFHPAMRFAAPTRRDIGIRTIFNIIGPLANPAGATHQLLGVFRAELLEPMAAVLMKLGAERALVVHGADGMDEVTLTGETLVWEARRGEQSRSYRISPEEFGLPLAAAAALRGGDAAENARLAGAILAGESGPLRDVVTLNAAVALYAADAVADIGAGLRRARESIDSGAARRTLAALIETSHARVS